MGLWYLFFQVVWPVSGPMESTGVLCKGGCSWCILCFSGWSLLGLGAGPSSSRVRDKLGWCWLGKWSWSQEQNPGRGVAMPIGGSLSILDFLTGLLFCRSCAGKPCLLWIHGCDSHVTSTGCHFASSNSSMTLILSFSVLTWFSSTRKLHPCYCPWHCYLNNQTLCVFSWGKHIFWIRIYSSQTHTYVKDKKLPSGSFRCSIQNQPLHEEYEEWLTVK